MKKRDPVDHALHTLLEEELGGRVPPDVCGEVLARIERRAPRSPVRERRLVPVGAAVGGGPHHSKRWLLPILIVLGLVGFALVLGGTGAAPFIYTMF